MSGAKHLTGEECRRVTHAIRGVMAQYGVNLHASLLEADLAEAEWLAGFDGNVLFSSAWDAPNRQRTIGAACRVLRLKRVAWALLVAAQISGFEERVARLRDLRVLPLAPHGDARDEGRLGEAWDLLFEIEVAAQLCGGPFGVEFAEPDIVVSMPGDLGTFAIACKRPRRSTSVPGALGDALRQLARFDGPGIVALSLDLLLPSHDGAPRNWVIVKHDRQTQSACNRLVGDATSQMAGAVGSVVQRAERRSPRELAGVGGVLGVANLVVLAGLDGGGQYMNTKVVTTKVPLLDAEGNATALAAICHVLELGQAEFRTDAWLAGVDASDG